MIHTYNVILFRLKNKENSDTNKSWGHYAKWNKPGMHSKKQNKTKHCMLYEVSKAIKLIETKCILFHTCYKMNETGKHCAKQKKPVTRVHILV